MSQVYYFDVDWWYWYWLNMSTCAIEYQQPHCSPFQDATGYTKRFLEGTKIIVNLIKISEFINPYLLWMKIIASFVSRWQLPNICHYFCSKQCVWYCTLRLKALCCTRLSNDKLAINDVSRYCMLTFSRFYVHFTIHYLLATCIL